jgi:hypothetical protein
MMPELMSVLSTEEIDLPVSDLAPQISSDYLPQTLISGVQS